METKITNQCVCCGSTETLNSPAVLLPFIAHRVFGYAPVEISKDWDLERYGVKTGWNYFRCNTVSCSNCQHIFLDVRFTDDQMSNLYDKYREEEYTTLREHYEPGYISRNDNLISGNNYVHKIEDFISPYLTSSPAILDWGGDTGKNTPFVNECSLLHIFDISKKEAIEKAVIVDEEEVKKNSYDLVVCCNVLEHIPYPLDLLKTLTECMSPETLLYIELPYENLIHAAEEQGDLPEVYRKKRHWHEHINFFNFNSIKTLVARSGLTLLDIKETPITEEASSNVFQVLCRK